MSSDTRRAVDLLLSRVLLALTESHEGHDRRGEGALLALEALDVLSSEEAAEWRARFEIAAAASTAGPRADSAERRRAEAYLQELAGSLAEAAGTEAREQLLSRLNGAFAMGVQTGLTDAGEAARWGGRVETALGMTIEDDPDEIDEPDYIASSPSRGLGSMIRLVPAERARHDGLCVTAAVLHERGFELHWHALREGDHEDGDVCFQARDDVGTAYGAVRPSGAGWSGRDGVFAVLGESRCSTAVPAVATVLRVARGDAEWLIPLDGAG